MKNKYKIIIPQEEPKQIKCYCGHTITCDCEPKQETLEEAAEIYTKDGTKHYMEKTNVELAFIAGAKWQQERSYSEEDLRNAYRWGTLVNQGTKKHFNEWFEQFKKK